MSNELIEKVARSMAEHTGWDAWDTARTVCDTPDGSEADDHRDYFRDLARVALAAAGNSQSQDAAVEAAEEGREILTNLISGIEQHGNYSKGATLTFLNQLKQCIDQSIAAMGKQEGGAE